MTQIEQFSDRNITNSVATYLGTKLLLEGYVVYWSLVDAMQTADGWYYQYSQNRVTYLADTTFSTALHAAQGIISLVNSLPAVPRFIIRPTVDGAVPTNEDEVMVPTIALDVGAAAVLRNYELGTGMKWRARAMILDGLFRSEQEQSTFQDKFAIWFDHENLVDVYDHVAGNLAFVGSVSSRGPSVATATNQFESEATTYEALLHAQLEYVA